MSMQWDVLITTNPRSGRPGSIAISLMRPGLFVNSKSRLESKRVSCFCTWCELFEADTSNNFSDTALCLKLGFVVQVYPNLCRAS